MATNPVVSSEAGFVELLGRACYDDYFNEAIKDFGDISTELNIIENACAYCGQATAGPLVA